MRLSQLNGLLLIQKYGSISKAAQESFLSQSALSVSIKELEEELGNTILIRTKRGVAFTNYGLQVLEHASRIFEEVDQIQRLEAEQSEVHGNVVLGTSSYYCNILATELLLELKRQFPGINLQIHQDKNVNVIRDVLLGDLDVGLLQVGVLDGQFYYPKEFLKSKLEFHQLFMRPMKIAVGENHPLRDQKGLRMADLAAYRYVTNKNLDEDLVYQKLKENGYANEVIQVNDVITRSVVTSMHAMNVVMDLGLEAGNRQYQNQLYPLDVQDFYGAYTVGWIHKSHPLSPAEQKMLELLNEQTACYRE